MADPLYITGLISTLDYVCCKWRCSIRNGAKQKQRRGKKNRVAKTKQRRENKTGSGKFNFSKINRDTTFLIKHRHVQRTKTGILHKPPIICRMSQPQSHRRSVNPTAPFDSHGRVMCRGSNHAKRYIIYIA